MTWGRSRAIRQRSIGVVAYEMEGRPTGVGRYLEELLVALRGTPRARDWRCRLFFQGKRFDHALWTEQTSGVMRCEAVFDGRAGAHPVLWEQVRLPRLLRRHPVDLLFSPGYSLPTGPRLPSLVTIHDLAFEHRPRDFGFRERWRRRLLARRAARNADRVLTDTERTAVELRQLYGVPAERIAVAPLGVSARFRGGGGSLEQLAALGIRPPYLLALGAVLPRRRLDLVIRAFSRLCGDHAEPGLPADLQLVIAGPAAPSRASDLNRLIGISGVADRVIRMDYVDDEALPGLYAGATGVAYVSEYEGFGLPPLEALAAGVPALIGDSPALDELWPAYPFRCEASDGRAVTAGLRRLVVDLDARRRVRAEAPERLRTLTWTRTAESFAAAALTVLDAARRPER